MGLFGGSKTYVASTVYNLAGDEAERANYLKTMVIGTVIGSSKFSMGDVIRSNYLPGPGMVARSFFRWSLANYQDMGIPGSNLGGVLNISEDAIKGHLEVPEGHTVLLQSVAAGPADYTWWAEQWMLENRSARLEEEWVADYVNGEIKITYPDATTDSFAPDGLDPAGLYVYVVYSPVTPAPVPPATEPAEGTVLKSIYWIYKQGSGKADLDAAMAQGTFTGEFFPVIPIRYENQFLSATYMPAAYELARKAYRKATGRKKFSKLVDKIAENESLKDIDHAFMTYGVCLNVKENACREYIFRLFEKLWQRDAALPGGLLGTKSLRVTSSGPAMLKSLDMEIRWGSITKSTGTGQAKAGAKRGKYWVEKSGAVPGQTVDIMGDVLISLVQDGMGSITIYAQLSDNYWEALTVTGLSHRNHVYKDKSVIIGAHEALDDVDDTGFIIPLHYPTVREMSLVDSTQMMTAATFIVFNSYKVVKQKWYQTGIFKIVVFIIVVVITVVTMGSGAAPAASIGASLVAAAGITGIVATIVAVAINALVGMIIAKIIGMLSVEIFGEKWGAIIGAVLTVVATMGASAATSGQSISAVWNSMMNPVGIMNMTSALSSGITGYMQASAMQTMAKGQALTASYEKQISEINQQLEELVGNSRGSIDPLMLTDAGREYAYETADQFLGRTLMTGTDIANMTLDMLTNMADYTTSLPGTN